MRPLIGLAVLLLVPCSLWAQTGTTSSGTGSSGSTGTGSSGASSSGTSGGTTSNFDNTAFQNRINTALQRGKEYLRSNRNSTTTDAVNGSFVGADLSDMRDFLGMTKPNQARTRLNNIISGRTSTGTNSSTSRNRMGRSPGSTSSLSASPNGLNNGPSSSSGDTDVPRAAVRADIAEAPSSATAAAELSARLQRQVHHSGPNTTLSVQLNEGVATLRGTVRSEHERAVCCQMLALEPGVSQVKNLLTVAPASQSQP